ncbi:hypothetical protein VTI28DRAFT_4393 [Corynascus sepedonium]
MAKHGILYDDVYNFDETRFMMGIIYAGIQGVNALGWAIPPFTSLAAKYHLAGLYTETNLPDDWHIAIIDNGWTTNEVGLDWIKHID